MSEESGGRLWHEKLGLFLIVVAGLWMFVSAPVSCAGDPGWAAINTCTRDLRVNPAPIALGVIGATVYFLPNYYRPESLPW